MTRIAVSLSAWWASLDYKARLAIIVGACVLLVLVNFYGTCGVTAEFDPTNGKVVLKPES